LETTRADSRRPHHRECGASNGSATSHRPILAGIYTPGLVEHTESVGGGGVCSLSALVHRNSGQHGWRGVPCRAVLLLLVLVGFAAGGAGPALAASSPLMWERPALVDDQPPFAVPGSVGSVSCPAANLCVAGGASSVLTSSDPTGGAGAWSIAHLEGDYGFAGISCPSVELCVDVGGLGEVLTSTDPAGGAHAWSEADVDPKRGEGEGLTGVSCPSVHLCVLSGYNGDVLTSTDPTGGASAWTKTDVYGLREISSVSCPTERLCVAVTEEGDIVTSTDPTGGTSAWTLSKVDNHTLEDVSCSSEALCVVIDNFGYALTSTDPTGGTSAWSAARISDEPIEHVSCVPSGLCVVLGNENEVFFSTDPTGGVSAWSATPVDIPYEYSLNGVSCSPDGSVCVLADSDGGVIASTDPMGGESAWAVTELPVGRNSLYGVSCASIRLCVGVDDAGNVLSTVDPDTTRASWDSAHVDANKLAGVSCPSVGLCVAVDGSGGVLSSTDPAGGAGAWHLVDVDGSIPLLGVSCASASLCVATDWHGDLLSSTEPTGGASAWHIAYVAGEGSLGAVSCPSVGLCVALDGEDPLVSTEPDGGASAWTKLAVAVGKSISCPSTELCVTARYPELVYTSTDPAGGAGAWQATDIGGLNGLQEVSCAAVGLCVATTYGGGGSSPGNVYVSSDPTGGPEAWIQDNVYGNPIEPPGTLGLFSPELSGVFCVNEGMCLVTDLDGRVMTGTTTPPSEAPANVTPPSISGTAVLGEALSCSEGSWTGNPPPTLAYQWLRDGQPIAGASAAVYTIQNADQGHTLACQVTATNSAGSEQATSNNTIEVPSSASPVAPVDLTPPSISGTPAVGQPLFCSAGAWWGEPTPEYAYQWLEDGEPIAGATTATYTVQSAGRGHDLTCQVTATNGAGAETADSNTLLVPTEQPSGDKPGNSPTGSTPPGDGSASGGSQSPFTLARIASCSRGKLQLTLELPEPGALRVIARSIVAPGSRDARRDVEGARRAALLVAQLRLTVTGAGQTIVTLAPAARAKAMLAKQGELHVAVTITYTPKGGEPGSVVRSVVLKAKGLSRACARSDVFLV
jgi:PQQ-like domain